MDKQRKYLWLILFIILINGLGLFAFSKINRLYDDVINLKNLSSNLISLSKQGLQKLDPNEIVFTMSSITVGMGNLENDVRPFFPILDRMSDLPWIGEYAAQVQPLIQYGSGLSRAGMALVLGTEPFFHVKSENTPMYKNAFDTIKNGQPYFNIALKNLEVAETYRPKINPSFLPGSIRENWQKIGEIADQLLAGLEYVDPLLIAAGANQPQTYLLLIQNRDELRATGGFITGFGLLRFDQGLFSLFYIQDSTDLNWIKNIIQPPKPMQDLMGFSYWLPRDANWSPDFPTTAEQAQKLYNLATEIPTDGVLAINQGTLDLLLGFTGPIPLADEGITIDQKNLEVYMIRYKMAAIENQDARNRKEFMSKLGPLLVKRVLSINKLDEVNKFKSLIDDLRRGGYLLIYSDNPQVQDFIEKLGFSGKVNSGSGDYLMLVDSNIYNKFDSLMNKKLEYSVDLTDPANPNGTIHLHYENPMRNGETCQDRGFTDITICQYYTYLGETCEKQESDGQVICKKDNSGLAVGGYWNYWRVMTTYGSRLTGSENPEVPPSYIREGQYWSGGIEKTISAEGGTTQYASLVVVRPEESKDIKLFLKLPSQVITKEGDYLIYSLKVQNQPGINNREFHIEIKGPAGYVIDSSSQNWQVSEDKQKIEWDGILNQAIEIWVDFRPLSVTQ